MKKNKKREPEPTAVTTEIQPDLTAMSDPVTAAGSRQEPPTSPRSVSAAEPKPDPPSRPDSTGKKVSSVLGEILWLLTRSQNHRYFFIGDLEWLVLPPVSLGQFRIYQGEKHPIGVVFWAFVDEAVEHRLKQGINRLAPNEWRAGDRLWLVEAITPFGNVPAILDDLKTQVFPEQRFKYLQRDAAGKIQIRESGPGEMATGTASMDSTARPSE